MMDLTHLVVSTIGRPKFLYVSENLRKEVLRIFQDKSEYTSWCNSTLNPLNRVNSLELTKSWRVDGFTGCGTRFYLSLQEHCPLRRIDVFITEPSQVPECLVELLDLKKAISHRDFSTTSSLGICRYLCQIFQLREREDPEFLKHYRQLPFGSKLVVEKITRNIQDIQIHTIPAYHLHKQTKSVSQLKAEWQEQIPHSAWPPSLDLDDIDLIRQLHDTVSVVTIPRSAAVFEELLILKSSTDDFAHLYHELRFLLRCPPHVNIMSKPMHIVTSQSGFGGKKGVVGFTMSYFKAGSIRDVLPLREIHVERTVKQGILWTLQVISAINHCFQENGMFYSELRPDNILINDIGGSDHLILCDFEQRGNWHEWCPPEILYAQYVENLRTYRPDNGPQSRTFEELFTAYDNATSGVSKRPPDDKVINSNWPWFALSKDQQEKAQVYTVGLLMYCIFEGLSNVCNSIVNAFSNEKRVEFPEFVHTPPALRGIIRKCTLGAPEWETDELATPKDCIELPPRSPRLTRKGFVLYPANSNSSDLVSAELQVIETGSRWWTTEIERAFLFFKLHGKEYASVGKARPTLLELADCLRSLQSS